MSRDLLIVDDDPFIRTIVATTLRGTGTFRIHEAADGEDAIKAAGELDLGLVLLDVQMPKMDGIEACRLLHESHPDATIVMLTASGDEDVERRAREAGATRFLTKPFSPLELLELVERVRWSGA